MADIRINALATTAASTASDDFIAVDGSANGTRKLNAYSPTFGGNLTVSGTGTSSFGAAPSAGLATNSGIIRLFSLANDAEAIQGIEFQTSNGGSGYGAKIYTSTSGDYIAIGTRQNSATWAEGFRLNFPNNAVTLTGNLTVSGTGESTFSGTIVPAANISKSFGKTTSAWLAVYAKYIQQNDASGYLTSNTDGSIALNSQSNQNITLTPHGTGIVSVAGNLTVSGTGNSSVAGTLLVATTTNSSNGALQLATHTTSAGGIGFGANMSLFKGTGNGAFYFDDNSGANNTRLFIQNAGVTKAIFETYNAASAVYIGSAAAGFSTIIYSGNSSTALTLDSSQNATFAGTIKPQQAATASAPSYVKGAIYFDTTLNKLRVGGATGWETITSV